MKEFLFKIPELEAVPPDSREVILRRCLDSEEFARRLRRIQRFSFISSVAAAIATLNIFTWSGVAGDRYWLSGVLAVVTVVIFIAAMILSQMWFRVRLVRSLVRKQVTDV